MSQTIRLAGVEDADAISALKVSAWRVAYRGIFSDELLDGLDVGTDAQKRRARMEGAADKGIRNWLLEEHGLLVGWAATGPCNDDDLGADAQELYAIYLDPERVGEGHGRRLMAHCLSDCVARGHGEMVMWVLTGNERAQRFYAAAGFERDERVPPEDFRDTGATKLRMVRSLAGV